MFASLYALSDSLRVIRGQFLNVERPRPIQLAAAEVFDRLIARVDEATGGLPPSDKPTLSLILDHGDKPAEMLSLSADILSAVGDVMSACGEAVYACRQPGIDLIGRIESEGYHVDIEDLTTVTDPRFAQAVAAADGEPDAQVQLAAERIARAEQASIYQRRLENMEAARARVEAGYVDELRKLAVTLALGGAPEAS